MPTLTPLNAAQLIPEIALAAGQETGRAGTRQFQQARGAQIAQQALQAAHERNLTSGPGFYAEAAQAVDPRYGGPQAAQAMRQQQGVQTYTGGGRVGTPQEAMYQTTMAQRRQQEDSARQEREQVQQRLAQERSIMREQGIDLRSPEARRYLGAIERGEDPDDATAAAVRGLSPQDYARVTTADAGAQRAETAAQQAQRQTQGGGLTPAQQLAEQRRQQEAQQERQRLIDYVRFADSAEEVAAQLANPTHGPKLIEAITENDLPAAEHEQMIEDLFRDGAVGPSLRARALKAVNQKMREEIVQQKQRVEAERQQERIFNFGQEADRLMESGIREIEQGGLRKALELTNLTPEEYEQYLEMKAQRMGLQNTGDRR